MLESMLSKRVTEIPTVPGIPFQGGYYVGRVTTDSRTKLYALIVAPKWSGETTSQIQWSTTSDNLPTAVSLDDGWLNTEAMMQAGPSLYPSASFCRSLVIDGYDDWYLPSINEIELLYRFFKPSTALNNISPVGKPNKQVNGYNPTSEPIGMQYTQTDPAMTTVTEFIPPNSQAFSLTPSGLYWSSTQAPTAAAAWRTDFTNGNQVTGPKSTLNFVRAVRRVLIS